MSEAKIDQKNLYHLPILLVINISYKVNLQFLNFIQALRQFKDDKHPEIGDSRLLGWDVGEEYDNTDEIDPKVLRDIIINDIFDDFDFLACWILNWNEVEYNFHNVKG